ncbi:hypothetical protein [Nocardia beijingensis]
MERFGRFELLAGLDRINIRVSEDGFDLVAQCAGLRGGVALKVDVSH